MALFAIQLLELVVAATGQATNAEQDTYQSSLVFTNNQSLLLLYSTDNVAARV